VECERKRGLHPCRRQALAARSAHSATVNVQAEEADPNSLLAWYKALIHLKKTNPAFADGTDIMLDPENTKVLSWMRQRDGAPQWWWQ